MIPTAPWPMAAGPCPAAAAAAATTLITGARGATVHERGGRGHAHLNPTIRRAEPWPLVAPGPRLVARGPRLVAPGPWLVVSKWEPRLRAPCTPQLSEELEANLPGVSYG